MDHYVPGTRGHIMDETVQIEPDSGNQTGYGPTAKDIPMEHLSMQTRSDPNGGG